MTLSYQFLELFATFIEGAIGLLVSINLAGRRYGKVKNFLSVLAASSVYTVIITLLNKWQTFSFFTLFVAILFTLIMTLLMTKAKLIYKFCATMLTWFSINFVDYIISYILIMILGRSINLSEGIPLILSSGRERTIYIIVNKLLQIIIFISLKKLYPKLLLLNKRSVAFILATTSFAYVFMSALTNLILTDSIVILQIAVIFSLLFIAISIITTIISVTINAKYLSEKSEKNFLTLANVMMEKNFREYRDTQNTIRKQVHDFKNHLRIIESMLPDDSKARGYLTDLLEASYKNAQNCNCGNEVIDSIINCKMNEALNKNIEFIHKIQLNTKMNISSVDICAILANQIDNALEACMKIEEDKPRHIKVEIWQKESFVFFKVTNTVKENPFKNSHELQTTKADKKIHGFGIKSIQDTAEKYNGYLKNCYMDECFVSLVMTSNNE